MIRMFEGLWLWIKENIGLSIGLLLLALLAIGNIIKNEWLKRQRRIKKAPKPTPETPKPVAEPKPVKDPVPSPAAEVVEQEEAYPVLEEVFEDDWEVLRTQAKKPSKVKEEDKNPLWVSERISQRLDERVAVMQQEFEAVKRSIKELADEQRERKLLFEDLLDKRDVLKEMIDSLNDHSIKQGVIDASQKG